MVESLIWWRKAPIQMSGLQRPRAVPPSRALLLGGLLAVLLGLGCLRVALVQPYLGLEMIPGSSEQPPVLLLPGAHDVSRIADDHGHSMALRSDDLEPEPDVPFHDYPAFNHFLQRQGALSQIIRDQRVHITDVLGRSVVIRPQPRRKLTQLPWLFWYQLLVGFTCWLCGLAIWAFRRNSEPAAVYCALSGLGILLMTDSSAVYSTRELALPYQTFRALSSINHFGAMLSCGAFIAVLWYYPKRLGRIDPGPWLVSGYLLLWLLDLDQRLPLGNYGLQLVVLSAFAGMFSLAGRQWWVTRGDPLQRAALHWFLLSWCLGSGFYLILVTLPTIAGFDSGALQSYAYGGLLLIAVGLGLGVARYRLFDLETWWFRALAFLIGGFIVVAMDLLLTTLLAFDAPTSLAISLGVSGWIYFPARQWLAARLFASGRRLRNQDVPALLRDLLSGNVESTQRLLPDALQRLYSPLSLKPLAQPVHKVAIGDNGLSLRVPGIGSYRAWEVYWPNEGNRLFNRDDVEVAMTVRAVLDRVAAYQRAVERGVEQERARLTQDLHDDIGARLLGLLHHHPDAIGSEIREVLESLRFTVHGLNAPPLSLSDAADAWRAEAAERCQTAGVTLKWRQPERFVSYRFNPVEHVDLSRVLREAISNALRHADSQCVEVSLECDAAHLGVTVENDGVAAGSTAGPQGLGLRNMRSRISQLGGRLEFELIPPVARVHWSLPLQPTRGAPPHSGGRLGGVDIAH